MTPLLKELLEVAARGPAALETALDADASRLTPQLGEEARQRFRQAIDAKDVGAALAAVIVASRIFHRLGDRPNELRNQLDFWQLQFMRAGRVEEYARVREASRHLAELADKIPAPELAFEAAVLAADSAYFAGEAVGGPDSVAWLITALDDLVVACGRVSGVEKDGGVFLKFVSLLASTVDKAMGRVLLDEDREKVDALLRKIAAVVDDIIPPDFRWPSDPTKTSAVAAALTRLADGYGR